MNTVADAVTGFHAIGESKRMTATRTALAGTVVDPVGIMNHADSYEGNHIPKRDSALVLTDSGRDVVQKVCMNKLILHHMELCVLEAESLKSYSSTDCGREPFADSYLQERSDTVEHVTATNGRPKKS